MKCCGFGHREVFENIAGQVYEAVLHASKEGCTVFYTGAMGAFDSIFSSAVHKAKSVYPNIKLVCVKPYLTTDINENKEYYEYSYDDVIVPDELAASITKRLSWQGIAGLLIRAILSSDTLSETMEELILR